MLRILISLLLLAGFLGLDFALTTPPDRLTPMSAFPAFIFASMAACQPRHSKAVRIACGAIAVLAAILFAILKWGQT